MISEEDWVEDTVNDKDISWAKFERDLISFNDEGCKIDRGAQNTWLKKIGEDATEKWMKANNITYVKDNQLIHPDKGDFNCNNILIDVKASHYRFNNAETGLQSKVLVNDQQLAKKVYDIYVFVKLDTTPDDFWVKYNLKHTPKIINVKGEEFLYIGGSLPFDKVFLNKKELKDLLPVILKFLGYSDKQIDILKLANNIGCVVK